MQNKKQRPNTSYHKKQQRSFSPASLISPLPTPAFPDFKRIEKIVVSCNEVAIQNMRKGDFDSSFSLLKKAEFLLEHTALDSESKQIDRNHLLDITYNNLGCYYKRKNKPNVALNYLMKVLLIEERLGKDKIDVAATNLNISAILSQLAKHKQAYGYAKYALELAKEHVKVIQEQAEPSMKERPGDSTGGDLLTSLRQENTEDKENTTGHQLENKHAGSAARLRPISGKSQNSEIISSASQMQKEGGVRGTTPDNDSQVPFTEPGVKTNQGGYSQNNNPSASSPNLKTQNQMPTKLTKSGSSAQVEGETQGKVVLKKTNSGTKIETQSSTSEDRKRPSTGARHSRHGETGPIPEVSRDHEDEQPSKELRDVPPSAAATLVIAYHNVGAELEHLGELKRAINIYKSALSETRGLFPGMSDAILKTIEQALEDCKEKYKKRQQLHFTRLKQRAIKSTAMMYNDKSHLQSVDLRKLQNRTFSGDQIGLASIVAQSDPLNRSATKPITAGLASINQSRSGILGSRQKLNTTFSGISLRTGPHSKKRFASLHGNMRASKGQASLIKQYGWNGSMSGTQMRGVPSAPLGQSLDISQVNLHNLNSLGSTSDIGFFEGANPLMMASPKSQEEALPQLESATQLHISPQPLNQSMEAAQQAYYSPPLPPPYVANVGRKIDLHTLHKRLLTRKFQSLDASQGITEESRDESGGQKSILTPKLGKIGKDHLRLQEILRRTKYIEAMQHFKEGNVKGGKRAKGRGY